MISLQIVKVIELNLVKKYEFKLYRLIYKGGP